MIEVEAEIRALEPGQDWERLEAKLCKFGCRRLHQADQCGEYQSSWDLPYQNGEFEFHLDRELDLAWLTLRLSNTVTTHDLDACCQFIDEDQVMTLLRQNDGRKCRQGIRLAGLLDIENCAAEIYGLCKDPRPMVAVEARNYCQQLNPGLVANNDPVQLFSSTANPRDRRQILRWLISDFPQGNQRINDAVATALNDSDWETRVSAVIAAVRYGMVPLAKTIEHCELQAGPGQSLFRRDKELLQGIRHVGLLNLLGKAVDYPANQNPKHYRGWRLFQEVAGIDNTVLDLIKVMIGYFTKPHPLPSRPPKKVLGIGCKQDKFYLGITNIEMVWIPAIPHLLGSEEDNSLEEYNPEKGFYISRLPLLNQREEPILVDQETSKITCKNIQQQCGLPVTLPTPKQREMAARGADGRQYPWGWGVEADGAISASPWGLLLCWLETGEWCEQNGQWFVSGTTGSPCAKSKLISPDCSQAAAMRVVFNPDQ